MPGKAKQDKAGNARQGKDSSSVWHDKTKQDKLPENVIAPRPKRTAATRQNPFVHLRPQVDEYSSGSDDDAAVEQE